MVLEKLYFPPKSSNVDTYENVEFENAIRRFQIEEDSSVT